MANGHKYTKEQDEFIRNNYTNVSECVRKFNEKFNTQQSYQAIKTYANRKLGITTGFRPWTKEMDNTIADLLRYHPYKKATELFNKQFGTSFTRKQVQDHCTRVGISRFQFTHPYEVRLVDVLVVQKLLQFQFTHPYEVRRQALQSNDI